MKNALVTGLIVALVKLAPLLWVGLRVSGSLFNLLPIYSASFLLSADFQRNFATCRNLDDEQTTRIEYLLEVNSLVHIIRF